MSTDTPFWGPDFDALAAEDPEIAGVILGELDRLRGGLQLIASENFTSPAVLAALGSTLSNKYAEGYPGRRYYGGCEEVDKAEMFFPVPQGAMASLASAKANDGKGHADIKQLDDALNDGTEDLLINLRNFARANMEADVERLIEAIHLDRIEPMDF